MNASTSGLEGALPCLERYRLAVLESPSIPPEQLDALRIACDRMSEACTTRLMLAAAATTEPQQIAPNLVCLLQQPPSSEFQTTAAAFVDLGDIKAGIIVHKRIDKGGCGVVYLGSLRDQLVAVKTPSLNHYTEQGRREVAAEIGFLQGCPSHLNLVRGLGHGTWGGEAAVVLEQCDGDLQPHQLAMPCFEQQIRAGLEHLRENGWRNPDIKEGKTNNIMVKGTTVKLIDFGQSFRI